MNETYAKAWFRIGWLLDDLEARLSKAPDGSTVDLGFALHVTPKRLPSEDEAFAALQALEELGILREDGAVPRLKKYRFSADSFLTTSGYREGVRAAINVMRGGSGLAKGSLCVAIPREVPQDIQEQIRSEALDLRAALWELLASAKRDIILAFPFWDYSTATELAELLARRIVAGVSVRILGRFTEEEEGSWRIISRLCSQQCRLLRWYSPSAEGGISTFHFKAAVSDGGMKAYIGSANLTTSSMRSRMEMGMILEGEPAKRVHEILNAVLTLATPVAY